VVRIGGHDSPHVFVPARARSFSAAIQGESTADFIDNRKGRAAGSVDFMAVVRLDNLDVVSVA